MALYRNGIFVMNVMWLTTIQYCFDGKFGSFSVIVIESQGIFCSVKTGVIVYLPLIMQDCTVGTSHF